jgi:CRP-like cAMP-binding protein
MIFEKIKQTQDLNVNDFLNDLKSLMTTENYPKSYLLHKENTICDKLFFINKGIARAYYFKEEKDITAHFALENGTITAIDSFIQRKKSRYNIEMLEDTTVSWVSYQNLQELLAEKPHYEKYIRLFLEQIYIDLAARIEDLLFHTAKERYDKIITNFPSLLQRVNLGHIASYIGITQETLSRIRAEK